MPKEKLMLDAAFYSSWGTTDTPVRGVFLRNRHRNRDSHDLPSKRIHSRMVIDISDLLYTIHNEHFLITPL